MGDFLQHLFQSDFMPHGHCYQWLPDILWLHVVSDAIIALAYYSIPFALVYFVARRHDLDFKWMFLLFGAFILLCGTTHVFEIWSVWNGTYRLTGVVKAITATASIATAIALWPTIPKALQVPSPDTLRRKNDALRRYADELKRSNQDLDNYAHVVSHDLKAPLRTIDYLAVSVAGDTESILSAGSKEDLETLRKRVRRMSMLLDSLLEYSRIGQTVERIERFDTAELVRGILALQGFPETFTVEIDERLPEMVTARAPFELVLRNLIENAFKHHHAAGGTIRISSRSFETHTEFCVQDDGPGIDPAYHAHIFNLFTTLYRDRDAEFNGSGLALVKRTVEQHGGTVRVESDLGRGAAFYFTWPHTSAPMPEVVVP